MKKQDKKRASIGAIMKKLLRYSKDMLFPMSVALLLAAGSAVLTIIGPDRLSEITQYITDGIAGEIDLQAIARVGLFLASIYVLSAVFGFIQNYTTSTVTLKLSNRLRNDILQKINRVPMKLFGRTSSGDILSRMTNDVQILAQTLSNSLPNMVSSICQFIGCIIMMFVTEWHMSLVAIAATLVGFGLMGLIMSRSQKYFLAQQTTLGDLNGYVEEMYSGHNVVRISCAENQMRTTFTA